MDRITNCSFHGEIQGNTSCNSSYDSDPGINTTMQAVFVTILFGGIFLSGIIGNGSVIFIVCKNKAMRSLPNIYIVSLALGDMLLIVFSVPFVAILYTFDSWLFGDFICKLNEYLQTVSLGVSVFTLTLLSVDRYRAISDPMRKYNAKSVRRTILRAASLWVLASVLAIPDAVIAQVETDHGSDVMFCTPYPQIYGDWYGKLQVIFRFIVYFAIPIILIGICYGMMINILVTSYYDDSPSARNKQNFKRVSDNSTRSTYTRPSRVKVARLVLSFVIVFIICWLPRHIYLLWFHYVNGDYSMFWYAFKVTGFCLAFFNSCVNPLALYLQSEHFRKYFVHHTSCHAPERRMHSTLRTYDNGNQPNTRSKPGTNSKSKFKSKEVIQMSKL